MFKSIQLNQIFTTKKKILIRSFFLFIIQTSLFTLGGLILTSFLLGISGFNGFNSILLLILGPIIGFLLSLSIDYRKAPLQSCLPISKIRIYTKKTNSSLKPYTKVKNRIFNSLSCNSKTKTLWGKKYSTIQWFAISLILGFICIILTNLLGSLLLWIWPDINHFQAEVIRELLTKLSIWQGILVIVICPAILEELVFRGRGFYLLYRYWGSIPSIVFSSLLFTLFHGGALEAIVLTPFAFFLAWLRLRSGSLFYTILVHFMNNSIAYTVAMLEKYPT